MDDQQLFYRYEEITYGHFDSDGDYLGSGQTTLIRYEFPVLRETDCGTWIGCGDSRRIQKPKWIKTNALRHWACHSDAAALDSFIARKEKQILILKGQLDRAKAALKVAIGRLPSDEFQDMLATAPF